MVAPANGATRTGTAVQCKTGFEKEAPTLARNVGGTVTVEAFPTVPRRTPRRSTAWSSWGGRAGARWAENEWVAKKKLPGLPGSAFMVRPTEGLPGGH